ncbi:TetR family transcriptional regulator [Aquibacillus halophilus]|uniref:TetR family transcriptional regulator n=1 Tax=Aquibacillus halophilus TaxID=930132 RepID=A0A6A8DCI8_9BACI|nr:TetR/AcrR family transcriptional regulator [Aquibacillus halophilus]MRH41501.1 TetR family transcriptional regulator [Aquibacillus halophilus]
MKSGRKEIQRARMWRYFLDAATEVIEEEGLDQVTIRKIADRAGYTSSTAYNYFKDLSHLKFFAAMRFTTDYINELPLYLEKGTNTIDSWLYSWECFCKHSFDRPEIYAIIFMDDLGGAVDELLADYYNVYEEDLIRLPEEIRSIVSELNFSKRSMLYIKKAVDEGFIKEEEVDLLADTTLMLWKGMMNTVLNHRRNYTKEQAVQQTLYYVYETVRRVIIPGKENELTFSIKK